MINFLTGNAEGDKALGLVIAMALFAALVLPGLLCEIWEVIRRWVQK